MSVNTKSFYRDYSGYFGGGDTKSVVDRIDYSNDTATASPKGPLSVNRYFAEQQETLPMVTLVVVVVGPVLLEVLIL